MATLQEILGELQTVDSNPNNKTFIKLMQDIAGNPNDATEPADDPNALYGKIVQLYNEMVVARGSDAEITEALNTINDLDVTITTSDPDTDATAVLNKTTNVLELSVPRGVDGIPAATPVYEFKYNEETGDIEYEVVSYVDVNSQILQTTKEW